MLNKCLSLMCGLAIVNSPLEQVKTATYSDISVKGVEVKVINPSVRVQAQCGPLKVTLSNGKVVTISAKPNAKDAKVSPDNQTVGWVEGELKDYRKEPWFFPSRLVFWKGGKTVMTFTPSKLGYVYVWAFLENGAKVGIASAGMHGPTTYELVDMKTGKREDMAMNYDKVKKPWVKKMPDSDHLLED